MNECMKCECCGHELSCTWTDTHGVGACERCGLPYTLFHYQGEGDERKRVSKPPECPIFPEWIEVAKRYHAETKGRVFPGEFDMGMLRGQERTYSGASEEDFSRWYGWLDAHKDELPKPREESEAA